MADVSKPWTFASRTEGSGSRSRPSMMSWQQLLASVIRDTDPQSERDLYDAAGQGERSGERSLP